MAKAEQTKNSMLRTSHSSAHWHHSLDFCRAPEYCNSREAGVSNKGRELLEVFLRETILKWPGKEPFLSQQESSETKDADIAARRDIN